MLRIKHTFVVEVANCQVLVVAKLSTSIWVSEEELKFCELVIKFEVGPWKNFYFNRVLINLVIHPDSFLSKFKPRKALIVAPHVIIKADGAVNPVHASDIQPEALFMLRHIELQVSPLDDTCD